MPVEVPTIVPIVPFGACVSRVTFRHPFSRTAARTSSGIDCMKPLWRNFSASKAGKAPFSAARSPEAA